MKITTYKYKGQEFQTTKEMLIPSGAQTTRSVSAVEEYPLEELKSAYSKEFLTDLGRDFESLRDEFIKKRETRISEIRSGENADSIGANATIALIEEEISRASKDCVRGMTQDPASGKYLSKEEMVKLASSRKFHVINLTAVRDDQFGTSYEALEHFLKCIKLYPGYDFNLVGTYSRPGERSLKRSCTFFSYRGFVGL